MTFARGTTKIIKLMYSNAVRSCVLGERAKKLKLQGWPSMTKCFRIAVVVNRVVSDGLLRNLDRTRSIVCDFKKGAVGLMTTKVRQSIAFAKSYKISSVVTGPAARFAVRK